MIVTCYYDIYNNPSNFMQYIYDFYDLAISGIPIIVFTELSFVDKFRIFPASVKVIGLPRESLELYNIANNYSRNLPSIRNQQKDTKQFLALMNSKIEFIDKAAEIVGDNTFMWLDFGILKCVKNKEQFIVKLKQINSKEYAKIKMPGYWNSGRQLNTNEINCRFCGSFFVMPRKYIKIFYGHSKNVLTDFCNMPMYNLCWETNVWYVIEMCAMRNDIDWYFADKDDSLLRNIDTVINL